MTIWLSKLLMTVVLLQVAINLRHGIGFAQVFALAAAVTLFTHAASAWAVRAGGAGLALFMDIALTFLVLYLYGKLFDVTPIGYIDAMVGALLVGFALWGARRIMARRGPREDEEKT
jgi:hypothetical protein